MVRVVIAALILASIWAPSAAAGAWPQPEERLLVILTTGRKMAPIGAFTGNAVESDSNSSQLFAEYGLRDDLTVGMTVYGEFSTTDDVVEARIGGHVRHRIWQGETGGLVSVQGGFSAPVERWLGGGLGDNRPNSATEVDLRVLYGRGWQWWLGNTFVSSELGFRIRAENLDEEIRTDVTVGHSPMDGVLAMLSAFGTMPLGSKTDRSLKIAPSIAYTRLPILGSNDKKPLAPAYPVTLQLGVSWDALNSDDGLNVLVSIWRKF